MKILELTNFSHGGCGVWQRVKTEAELLSKRGHEIMVLSSNLDKGTEDIVDAEDNIGDIKIFRYPAIKLGGESFMYWFHGDAWNKALEFKPDVIFAHNYRHLCTTRAIKLMEELNESRK